MNIWATSLLGVAVRCIFCGFPPPSYAALWDSKTPQRPASERVSWCSETSPPSRLPPRDRCPSRTLLSLFLSLILSYLLSKRMGCLSGCLVSSTSIQKLVCANCSAFKWSFDELVGEKVVSLSYSSAILGPPLKYVSYDQNSVMPILIGASLVAQMVRNLPANVGDLGWEDPLERISTTVFLSGESPWTEEPGRLQSMWSQRVRHDCNPAHTWLQQHVRLSWICFSLFHYLHSYS